MQIVSVPVVCADSALFQFFAVNEHSGAHQKRKFSKVNHTYMQTDTRTHARTHTHTHTHTRQVTYRTHTVPCRTRTHRTLSHERQCTCVILLFYLIYFILLICIPSPVLHERQCTLPTPPVHECRVLAVHCLLPMRKICDATM